MQLRVQKRRCISLCVYLVCLLAQVVHALAIAFEAARGEGERASHIISTYSMEHSRDRAPSRFPLFTNVVVHTMRLHSFPPPSDSILHTIFNVQIGAQVANHGRTCLAIVDDGPSARGDRSLFELRKVKNRKTSNGRVHTAAEEVGLEHYYAAVYGDTRSGSIKNTSLLHEDFTQEALVVVHVCCFLVSAACMTTGKTGRFALCSKNVVGGEEECSAPLREARVTTCL